MKKKLKFNLIYGIYIVYIYINIYIFSSSPDERHTQTQGNLIETFQ